MQDSRAKGPPLDRRFGAAATVATIATIDGTAAVFPAGFPLRQAAFARRRDHLLVRAQGHDDMFVRRFFAGGAITTLATRDGMEMSRHMVLLMLNISPRVEHALNALAVPGGRDF